MVGEKGGDHGSEAPNTWDKVMKVEALLTGPGVVGLHHA